jgi:4-hydroxy-3-methylbut-2-enyl diphosphate reductase
MEGSCPIVLKLQQKVKNTWNELKNNQGQIVIYGKKGHAEVLGLAGQTDGNAFIVEKMEDLEQIDFSKPIALFAQTTQPATGYSEIEQIILQRMQLNSGTENIPLLVTNSICGHVSKRGEHLAEFSKKHDVIIFVSGSNSSNGKVLLEICKKNNPCTYWVSKTEDVLPEWIQEVLSVGICGATSTPRWLMEEVSKKINDLTQNIVKI